MAAESWTESAVADLKRMLDAGMSAGQIATELNGGFSRNAVIGKVARMGLSFKNSRPGTAVRRAPVSRGVHVPRPSGPRTSFAELAPKDAVPLPAAVDGAEAGDGGILDVMVNLQPSHCRFPIGDPRSAGFRFCSDARVDGKPYCAHHVHLSIDHNPRS